MWRLCVAIVLGASAAVLGGTAQVIPSPEEADRCMMWIDLYRGEPLEYEDMLDDLAGAGVIYLGERHTVSRHHGLQERIIGDLVSRSIDIAIGLEMLPVDLQPSLDEYNRGEITFDEFAKKVGWEDIWDNYGQYRPAIEMGHEAGAPVLALNARREMAREVAMKGIEGLDPEWARQVPESTNLDQPDYRRELLRVMMVMAHITGQDEMMQRMFQAQVIKDEVMAEAVARFMKSPEGRGRTVVVLCGAGHIAYGYGIPSRVRSRVPGTIDRIVVFSESGDVVLSEREKAMAREIEITHTDLRENNVPYADYLHATALK